MKLHLDPRTKLFLILLCVLSAAFAPNLYFQFALVTLIGLLAAFSGKWQYALRGMIAYALICVFTVWCMGMLVGTWQTMFIAFLGFGFSMPRVTEAMESSSAALLAAVKSGT